jgi:hypothetical protein
LPPIPAIWTTFTPGHQENGVIQFGGWARTDSVYCATGVLLSFDDGVKSIQFPSLMTFMPASVTWMAVWSSIA